MRWITVELPDGTWEIRQNYDGEEYAFGDSGLWIEEPPPVPQCECGMEKTWQHNHKRSCPPNKHSDWCRLYRK